jgi:hypothetical protein
VKWLVTAIIITAASSFAADNPDILKFKNGVTFTHKTHQSYQKSECKVCHRKTGQIPGHIQDFSKDNAHRLCRTCHAMKKAGPLKCDGCHIH